MKKKQVLQRVNVFVQANETSALHTTVENFLSRGKLCGKLNPTE